MIIDSVQWVVAGSIAIAVHVAGILWLSFATPAQDAQPQRAAEGIAVSLGTASRTAAKSVEAVMGSPVEVASQVRAEQPAAAVKAIQPPAENAVEQAPTVIRLDAVDTAKPVEPEAAQEPAPPEPQAVTARKSTELAPTVQKAVAAQTVPESAPTVAKAVKASEAAPAQPREASTAKEGAVLLPQRESTVETSLGARTKRSDKAPAPEASEVAVSAHEIQSPASAKAPASAASVEASSIETASAESVVALPPRQVGPRNEPEPAAAKPTQAAGVEASAAPQGAPVVEQGAGPSVVETAKPQTVDLDKVQQGSGGGVMARYAGVLKGWLQKNMHYPRLARLAGQEGEVVVSFIIDRSGKVQSIKLETKSGFPLLDREAKKMIERSNPFPPMPDAMPGQRLEVRVPVSFHVRGESATRVIPPINLQ